MNNKKLGNGFESDLCDLLFESGYWCHNLAQNASGQPADVIAVKNGRAYLIDCKVCSRGRFPFSRVEENQDLSMKLWEESGNGEGWFALQCAGHIFMITHSTMVTVAAQQSSLSYNDMCMYGTLIEEWVVER
jgi:Holliday junction resolvase